MDSELRLTDGGFIDPLDTIVERIGGQQFFRSTGGKQELKSLATRRRLLSAAIDCLAQYGYAQTTTPMIARRAHMSRGAMLHHYATKLELIDATIDFICVTRLMNYIAAIRRLSEHERVDELRGLDVMWESLVSLEFQAFMELQIAARTDAELRALFEPKALAFARVQTEVSRQLFPEWSAIPGRLETAIDLCQATFQGLLLNRRLMEPGTRRVAVRHLFAASVQAYRLGAIVPAPVSPEEAAAEELAASTHLADELGRPCGIDTPGPATAGSEAKPSITMFEGVNE